MTIGDKAFFCCSTYYIVPNVEIVLSEGEPLGDRELPESGVVRLGVSELDPALVPVGPLEAVVVGHLDGALAGGNARLLVLVRAPSEEAA